MRYLSAKFAVAVLFIATFPLVVAVVLLALAIEKTNGAARAVAIWGER